MTQDRPYLIGLTGSIGMGKSTTAGLFVNEGVPVWDADRAVHRMYEVGGAAVDPIYQLYPAAVIDGKVSRQALRDWIIRCNTALARIEAVVLPLVAKDREEFIAECSAPIAVLDMPTLLENGGEKWVDTVVVVSVPAAEQRRRVMDRPGMTEEQFQVILAKQMPDAEKRARADHVIDTSTLDGTKAAVQSLLEQIRRQLNHA